jgi:glucoamylase
MESLDEWLEREYRHAARGVLASLSRTDIVKKRPGFGQSIRAAKGSVVAAPGLGGRDADPDYFFHWFRDSAVIIDALRLLHEAGTVGMEALTHLGDFVRFSLGLQGLDGRALVTAPSWRGRVSGTFGKYVRQSEELSAVRGDAVVAETRVNADGTLDISKWSRPQHDGAPLRALALLRWARSVPLGIDLDVALSGLVRADLACTFAHWREPAFDMWEEELGLHYHSLCVSAAALEEGSRWLDAHGADTLAETYRAETAGIRRLLDDFWLPSQGFYRSRLLGSRERSSKELDISVVLAAIHANADGNRNDEPHGVHDPRVHSTLARLEELFAALYPINRDRPRGAGPAMGRYEGDVYFSGGAYYFSTLGAAELCFRAALGREDAADWVKRGDAFLATVRAFTPPSGDLSEQFDQRTGEQTSAKQLAWSYAAFISCLAARKQCAAR